MNILRQYFSSSIGRKQIVALTSLALLLFVIAHLAGNFFIFLGPEAFNNYAKKLSELRPGLYLAEAILLILFLIHVVFTAMLVFENIRARKNKYAGKPAGNEATRSWATRLMPFTGTVIFIFIITHLLDFTFTDHEGPRSVLAGEFLGLYGVVVNSFRGILHSFYYIVAMFCIASHLIHGITSFFQTFGLNHTRYTPFIKKFSIIFGLAIACGYSAIPLYVLIKFGTL